MEAVKKIKLTNYSLLDNIEIKAAAAAMGPHTETNTRSQVLQFAGWLEEYKLQAVKSKVNSSIVGSYH